MKLRLAGFVCCAIAINGCGNGEEPEFALTQEEGKETVAVLDTTQGPITLRFYPDEAPEHARNFATLCGSGYYDGTYFHRVAPGYMIQGGDPNTRDEDTSNDGKGGQSIADPENILELEPSDLKHVKGALSMARSRDPDSAGSQFFIMITNDPALDGEYTVFGEVLEGMDAVEKIAEQPGISIPEAGGVNPEEHQYIDQCRLESIER